MGEIRITKYFEPTHFWVALIQEPNRVVEDGAGLTVITSLPWARPTGSPYLSMLDRYVSGVVCGRRNRHVSAERVPATGFDRDIGRPNGVANDHTNCSSHKRDTADPGDSVSDRGRYLDTVAAQHDVIVCPSGW
jgi:hypothetical protein